MTTDFKLAKLDVPRGCYIRKERIQSLCDIITSQVSKGAFKYLTSVSLLTLMFFPLGITQVALESFKEKTEKYGLGGIDLNVLLVDLPC